MRCVLDNFSKQYTWVVNYQYIILLLHIEQMESNSSTLSHSQKFHLKAIGSGATDANLTLAIKRGNVKSFIKQGVGSIGDGVGLQNKENNGLEDHLLQLKNSCCDLSKQIRSKQSETNKYKDEAMFTQQKGKKLKEERYKLEDRISQLQKSLSQVNSKRDSAFHGSKTYEHILERMKKDSIHNQLKKNQLTRQLKNLQKQHNMTEAKQYSLTEMEKLSSFGVKDAHEQFGEQKLSRKQKLSCIGQETGKKKEIAERLKDRQSQTDQIQQMAAGDLQDADLMRLKKFLNVQIFLKELLKSKIARLKSHFQPYEIAFYQIKSRTHVKDAFSLKNQFFNFQNSYTEKTEWVKVLESQLAEAQQQRLRLKDRLKQLSNNEIEILEQLQNKAQIKTLNVDRREISEKSMQYELSWQRMKSWMSFQAKKMGISSEQLVQNPGHLLKEICASLKSKKDRGSKKVIKQKPAQNLELVQIGVV